MPHNVPVIAAGLIADSVEFACPMMAEPQRGAERDAYVAALTEQAASVTEQRCADGTLETEFRGTNAEGRAWTVVLLDTQDVWNVSQHTITGVSEG